MIEELNYEPIRADQDVGSLIVQEMIERLAYSDLVLAEMTLLNANVYYEVGVRQAAQREGCVLIAANWARQAFDVDQMRRVTYALPEGAITDESAASIRATLKEEIRKRQSGITLVFQALPGYETRLDDSRAESFRDRAKQLAKLQANLRAARRVPKGERAQQALELSIQYQVAAAKLPSVALELLNLLKDAGQWQTVLGFVNNLLNAFATCPLCRRPSR